MVAAADTCNHASVPVLVLHATTCNCTASLLLWSVTRIHARFAAGKAIKGIPRDQVVIANKFGPMTSDHGGITQNSSPDYCRQSLNTALGNLGLDYIDLYIMRGWDHETPIEESVKTMAVRHIFIQVSQS